MEYRHNPPSLSEIRRMGKELEALKLETAEKKSLFGANKDVEARKDAQKAAAEELLRYQNEVILAHLENQNELLLELARKIDRLER